jgi:hypothetical protein
MNHFYVPQFIPRTLDELPPEPDEVTSLVYLEDSIAKEVRMHAIMVEIFQFILRLIQDKTIVSKTDHTSFFFFRINPPKNYSSTLFETTIKTSAPSANHLKQKKPPLNLTTTPLSAHLPPAVLQVKILAIANLTISTQITTMMMR